MNIGILGLGTVGGGVVNVLGKNENEIFARTGEQINITHGAVKSISEPRICADGNIKITEDAFEIVNNPEIDVVLELIGGTTIAKELVMAAINNNKHVITANKALIATHGNELLAVLLQLPELQHQSSWRSYWACLRQSCRPTILRNSQDR